jgi:lambda repressor-like predicted transcriptional regulator
MGISFEDASSGSADWSAYVREANKRVRERLAARPLEVAAARSTVPPARPRRTDPDRERLRRQRMSRFAAQVEADPDATPLRRLRVERGLTMRELAAMANVHFRTVANAETHPARTSRVVRRRIAQAIGVPESKLF